MSTGIPFGRYRLEERIGAGNLTEAFRAKSFGVEGFEKTLVIKRLVPTLARDPNLVEAFVAEAKLAVRLSHANVVQVFDLGRVDDAGVTQYFLATEFVAGRDLVAVLELCRRAGGAPIGFALFVASEAAKALDHAHRRKGDNLQSLGIVHGDVSPRSVLLSWDGEVKLSDFCLARALYRTSPGALAEDARLAKRLSSASPELLLGREVGPASDIFSLGALAYELLAGAHPFAAPTPAEVFANISAARFRPLGDVRSDVPGDIVSLIERALSQAPEARPPSMAAFYEELMAQVYATGARFGADDLSELLAAEEEPFDSVEPEELLEQTRTDIRRSELVPFEPDPPAERVAELKGERELSLLMLRARRGALPAEGREHARQVLVRYGGRLLAEVSGEVAAVFGLDAPDSLDTENAVRAGLVLVRSLAGFSEPQIGIDTGVLGVTEALDLVEDARVDRVRAQARRIASLTPRRVIVSAEAARNLRGLYALEPALTGMKGPRAPLAVGEPRALGEASGRFVGRKRELLQLGERLRLVGDRELAVVGLTGPHGVGKTRLLQEAARRLRRFRVKCYITQCLPRGHGLPESALWAMLRTLCGVREGDPRESILAVEPRLRALGLVEEEVTAVLAALGASPSERASPLGAALAAMFESLSEDEPHVFAWDNAHEIDPESCAALAQAIERLRLSRSRVMLLFAARPSEDAGYRQLVGFRDIELGELDEADVRRLISTRLGVDGVPDELSQFVRARAGGQPMFIEELLREAKDSGAIRVESGRITELKLGGAIAVPRPLRALLAARMRRLGDSEKNVLLAAAVLGAPVDISVLAAMLAIPLSSASASADELTQKGLVTREGPVTLDFGSLALPEIVLGEVEPEALAKLHGRAADAYPMVLGPDTEREAARIAHHASQAGAHSRAAGYYATSGFYHLANRRLERAVADFVSALEQAREEPLADWAECIAALGRAARHVRAGARLELMIEELSARLVAARGIDPVVAGKIAVDLALSAGALSHYDQARKLLAIAFESADPGLLRAASMADAEMGIRQGEFKQALEALARARSLSPGDTSEEHRRLVAEAQALAGAGEHDEALHALDRARALAGADDPVQTHERAKVRALIYGFRGEWERCASASAEAAEQARALGLPAELAIDLHNQGDALVRAGELPRAYVALMESLSVAQRIGAERLVNLDQMVLAYLEALNGSAGAERTLLAKLAHADAQKWTWDALAARTLHGRLLAKKGDLPGARRELELAQRMAEQFDNRVVVQDCADALAELGPDKRG